MPKSQRTLAVTVRRRLVRRLLDDGLAMRVGQACHDPAHDDRWCGTCEARRSAIEEYRLAVILGEDDGGDACEG
jgi:hypothetical protein